MPTGPSGLRRRTGFNHVGFLVSSRAELDAWQACMTGFGVEHPPVNELEGSAVLPFRDPDNIQLEFMSMG
jgi:glyoxylase I family protein